jgi:16S rRNA (guanine527-N7)-methyltransferase
VKEKYAFELPLEESERSIIIIHKQKSTPAKYPRKPGTPNKLPLE